MNVFNFPPTLSGKGRFSKYKRNYFTIDQGLISHRTNGVSARTLVELKGFLKLTGLSKIKIILLHFSRCVIFSVDSDKLLKNNDMKESRFTKKGVIRIIGIM